MYGLVFEILEEFVIEKKGLAAWHEIKSIASCKVADSGFLRRDYYPDDEIVDLVCAASKVVGMPFPDLLEVFGHFVVRHHYDNGYNDLMRCQGGTLRKWLSNLNAMHDHIQKSFPGENFQAPIYWCEDDDEVEGSILLHYYSLRGTLLVPMSVGIIKELAAFQFDVEVEMEQLVLQGENGSDFTSWRITATDPEKRWKLTPKNHCEQDGEAESEVDFSKFEMPSRCPFSGRDLSSVNKTDVPGQCPFSNTITEESCGVSNSSCKSLGLSLRKMKSVFPFHVLVDKEFSILQVGESFHTLFDQNEKDFLGVHIGDVLDISRPVLGSSWEWKALKKLEDQTFFLTPKARSSCLKKKVSMEDTTIKFKGSMIDIANGEVMFALSPDARNVVELRNMGLTLTDLPLHSCQRDAIFLGEYIVQEADKAHKLDQLSRRLDNERNLSNTLLYNMLPKRIADDLRRGKTVKPKHYDNVTLFFSDIEGFTAICDKVDPWAVIDLLNQLYSVMDFLAAHFDLYKVETIGDAYMCCSGLPFPDDQHAEKIANFALAVVECIRHIRSPVDGSPIKLRIGIHTGSCTAGVVGTLTPHYCLFGDMVNSTARHEQTSMAGKIQCSSDLFGRLTHFSRFEKKQYVFKPRGLIDLKGKGQSYTYWLENGASDNRHANAAALHALSEEVADMLGKKTWKMRRYFSRSSGAFRDETMSVSSGTTSYTSSSTHSSSFSDSSNNGPPLPELKGLDENTPDEKCDEDYFSDRNIEDLDQMIIDAHGKDDAIISFNELDWKTHLCRQNLVSNLHSLISPLLKLCLLHDSSEVNLPDNMDVIDGQLYSFIDCISKTYSDLNAFHNFHHAASVVTWANFLFERAQLEGSIESSPWCRFAIVFAALVCDCKHVGAEDHHLSSESHMISEAFGIENCQAKYSLQHSLDILTKDYSELYQEITWAFPNFIHLVRQSIMIASLGSSHPTVEAQKIMRESMHAKVQNRRLIRQRTESALGLILGMAGLGHYAHNYECFVHWNRKHYKERDDAYLAGRGSDPRGNWHGIQAQFISECVLPLSDLCESSLNIHCGLKQSVSENLHQVFQIIGSSSEKVSKSCVHSRADFSSRSACYFI